MSEKQYQISPIELVQWAEPLFGFGEGTATGFSEKTVASYEAAAGIRLPAAPSQGTKHCSGWIKIGRMCGRKPQGGERKRKEGKPRSRKYKEKWKGR